MYRRRRSTIVFGLILILIGGGMLAVRLVPGLDAWVEANLEWPVIIVIIGGALLVIGLLTGEAGMAVPACIVGGIGGILWWQNATGDWTSWSYVWALIPGFTGVGTVLAALFDRDRGAIRGGLWLILISLVMFVIFGSLFGEMSFLGVYWPVLLIFLGLVILAQGLFRRRK